MNSQFTESEYRLLADEIIRRGGFWQVDFGGVATINLPLACDLDLDSRGGMRIKEVLIQPWETPDTRVPLEVWTDDWSEDPHQKWELFVSCSSARNSTGGW